jgi:hypothetical protein
MELSLFCIRKTHSSLPVVQTISREVIVESGGDDFRILSLPQYIYCAVELRIIYQIV